MKTTNTKKYTDVENPSNKKEKDCSKMLDDIIVYMFIYIDWINMFSVYLKL